MSARRYDNLSDEQLAGLAQGGDRRAMDALVTRYEPLRARLLGKFGQALDEDLRNDLASEILIGAIELIRDYDPSKGVGVAGWLKATLWTKARDALAKIIDDHDEMTLDEDRDGAAEPVAVGASPPADPPGAQARYAELMDALEARLEPLHFRIFQLRLWGCEYAEIAEALDMTVGQVRNAISRHILPAAREVLDDHGYI
jgi:RNA polymerase sigma factor (sigma-70 family)